LDLNVPVDKKIKIGMSFFSKRPLYAISVNPATILSSTGTVQKENIANHFVLQLEVTYKF